MCHSIGWGIGAGLYLRRTIAQQRLLGALIASVALHVVLLSQLLPGTLHRLEPDLVPAEFVAKLWILPPSLNPSPPIVNISSAELATAEKHKKRAVIRQLPVSLPEAPSDVATSVAALNREPIDLPPAPARTSLLTDRPLDLSSQSIVQAVRRNASPSLAQAAREQLGIEPGTAAARLGQHIASGAVPDCLHNAPDGEVKSSSAGLGGLLALPFVAYAAMTGKCK
jgi:hypothetical protein